MAKYECILSDSSADLSKMAERTCMIMVTPVVQAHQGRTWKQHDWRNDFGKRSYHSSRSIRCFL